MSVAAARIEQRIIISGADNASDAIRKAQTSLRGLDTAAKGVQDTSGNVESALKGLSDFAGASEKSVSRLGDAFGATEALMRLVPGPAGLAAAAVAGLGLAAVVAAREVAQADARLRQAFDGETLANARGLKQAFDLSGESAVALGKAMVESGKSAGEIERELRGVVARAQEVGDDGDEAVRKFADGLTAGVTESEKLQNRLKSLGVQIKLLDLSSFAPAFLQPDVQKGTDAFTGKLKDLETQLKKEKDALADLNAGRAGAVADFNRQTDSVTKLSLSLGLNTTQARKASEATQAQNAAITRQREVVAALTRDIEDAGKRQEAVAETLKQADTDDRAAVAAQANQELLDAEDDYQKLLADKRKAAALRGRAAADRELAEQVRQAQQRVDFAIREGERASAAFDAEAAVSLRASAERQAGAERAADAIADARSRESASIAEVLRARGEFAAAEATEARQDAADRAAEIQRIEASIEARRKEARERSATVLTDGGLAGDPVAEAREAERLKADLATVEAERLARMDTVRIAFDERERRRQEIAADRAQRALSELRADIAQAATLLQGPAQAIGGKLGTALNTAAAGIAQVASQWRGMAASAPDAISAVGGVAAIPRH